MSRASSQSRRKGGALDAYILYRVFASRKSAGDYGSFPVPGETTVTVPAGKLKISYTLQVQLTNAAGGDPLEIKGPGFRGMGESLNTGSGWSRARVGTVEITDPGAYTVTAGPAIEDGVEPQILLGK